MSRQFSPCERALLLGTSTSELKDVLEQRFRVEVFPVDEPYPPSSDRELVKAVQRLNPDVVFTLIPDLRETTKVLQSVRQAASNIPIIVVLESCEPDDELKKLRERRMAAAASPTSGLRMPSSAW